MVPPTVPTVPFWSPTYRLPLKSAAMHIIPYSVTPLVDRLVTTPAGEMRLMVAVVSVT